MPPDTPHPGSTGAGLSVEWEVEAADRLAAVDHADGRRRPLRAAAAAAIAVAIELVVLPRPWMPWMWPLMGAGALFVGFAAWHLARVRGRRVPPTGAERWALRVDSSVPSRSGLVLRRDDVTHNLAPSAIRRLFVGADHVFLHLADREVVTIPCRVLDAPGAVDALVLAVEAHRRRGLPPAPEVPADRAVWRLAFVTPRIGGELRPLVTHGDVVVQLGPGGGWVQGPLGIVAFLWSAVRRVEDHAEGPRLTVGERVLVLPKGAFSTPVDPSRLLADVLLWWDRAHPASPPPTAPTAPRAPADRDNPYAPPR